MQADSESSRKLELSKGPENPSDAHILEQEMGFSHRQAIGELIFSMAVGHVDMSHPSINLSQCSAQPSKAHHQAVKPIFICLNAATRDHGSTCWRPAAPNSNHPHADPMVPITLQGFPKTHAAKNLDGFLDSDWGPGRKHQRSIAGIIFMLAGAVIFCKTRHQPTVASLSSTKAEFAAAANASKAALHLCSMPHELGVEEQLLPTVVCKDNNGARLMTNAQQPT
jgi:hypothetical protein